MTRRNSIKMAAAIIAMGLVSAFVVTNLLLQSAITNKLHSPLQHDVQTNIRRLADATTPLYAIESDAKPVRLKPPPPPPPPASSIQEEEQQRQEGPFDPDSYAYLIIHYHKTGHDLSRQLRDFLILAGEQHLNGEPASNNRENTFAHRNHEENTGCPRAMTLSPGIVHVQAAPNFFCDTNLLAEYLLKNDNAFKEKMGVKVIHLVRNPFDLAVSNFIYHTQWPTPELWVKTVDPCTEELWFGSQSLKSMVGPTLLVGGEDPIMTSQDFDSLHNVCTGLYRTSKKSKEWSYYTHLRHLESRRALMLATTHMMIQGVSGGDLLRMANNVIKLRQVQQLEDQIRIANHMVPHKEQSSKERMIQVMTLSMKQFTKEPYEATLRFLDFALEDAVGMEAKERIAREYEQSYREKLESGNEHITADKEILNGEKVNIVEQKASLQRYLRRHEVFGRVLGNVERLVQDSLRDSGSDI